MKPFFPVIISILVNIIINFVEGGTIFLVALPFVTLVLFFPNDTVANLLHPLTHIRINVGGTS
jgi:hypothetical protein